MNGFTKKRVGTMTLGEKLGKLRNDRRISLSEVSRVTHIQVAYLESLEEGEYSKLPADVYVRGFLRSYANFLNVDEQILLKIYDKEKGIKENLKKKDKSKKINYQPVNISSFVFTPKKMAILFSSIFVVLGLSYLYMEIDSFASAPSLVILSPESNTEISGNSVFVEGITETDAALFINGQPVLVSEEGHFRENLTLQPGINTVDIKSINKFEKEAIRSIIVRSNLPEREYENENKEIPAEENKSAEKKELKLDLRVDPGPVWLSVEADGNLVFSGTMLSGSVQSFKATDKIIVNSGKGEATFVNFNGKDVGALSQETGAARDIIFTKDMEF